MDPEPTPQPDPHHGAAMNRRAVVAGTGILALSAAVVGCGTSGSPPAPSGAPTTTAGHSPGPPADPGAGQAGAGPGEPLASTAEIPVGGGQVFSTEKVVVTRTAPDKFRAFSAVCTHQGCTLRDVSGGTINCACHGSQFDVTDGSVVTGPATRALESREVVVEDNQLRLL